MKISNFLWHQQVRRLKFQSVTTQTDTIHSIYVGTSQCHNLLLSLRLHLSSWSVTFENIYRDSLIPVIKNKLSLLEKRYLMPCFLSNMDQKHQFKDSLILIIIYLKAHRNYTCMLYTDLLDYKVLWEFWGTRQRKNTKIPMCEYFILFFCILVIFFYMYTLANVCIINTPDTFKIQWNSRSNESF